MSNLDFDVRPVAGRIGAEITGVDLASDLDDVTVKSVRAGLRAFRRPSARSTPSARSASPIALELGRQRCRAAKHSASPARPRA